MRLQVSIRKQAIIGLACVSFFVFLSIATGWIYTTYVGEAIHTIQRANEDIDRIGDLQISWLAATHIIDSALVTHQTTPIDLDLAAQMEDLDRRIQTLIDVPWEKYPATAAENQAIVVELQTLQEELQIFLQDFRACVQKGMWTQAEILRYSQLTPLQDRFLEHLNQLQFNIQSHVSKTVSRSSETEASIRAGWILVALATLLVSAAAGYFIVQGVMRPISDLVQTVNAFRDGNLSIQASTTGPNELNLLATTFNSMSKRLRELVSGLEQEITERKRIETALLQERSQAEETLQKRITALTQPLNYSSSVQFTDLFDLEEIQKIQDTFAEATGVASIITFPDGSPITRPSNFCRLCISIIRQTPRGLANCYTSDAIIGRQNSSGPVIQPCLSGGLWDAGASITVGGQHIANWLIGQVKNEAQDESRMLHYALEIEADPEDFKKALDEVPVMSQERFQKISQAFYLLANKLSLIAYQNVQQARFISERKKAEEALQQSEAYLRLINETLEQRVRERTTELLVAKDQAEAASRAKSVFLANMSHELRTPLNAILGYAQLLQRIPLDPDVIRDLNTIQQSGEHLLMLINDILDFSKIEAGKVELYPVEFDLLEFFDSLAEQIQIRTRLKNLAFRCEIQGNLPAWVRCDSTRLRQVLLNLLGNAVKFTDKGQITLRVRTTPLPDSKEVQLAFEVQDTGIGIENEEMERLFQPFEQVGDIARRAQGTGLGLAISRHLVRLMGSDLHMTSEAGKGSLFSFTLTLPIVEGKTEEPAHASPAPTLSGYHGDRRTILVVDDTLSNRLALVDMIKMLQFKALEASDGREAVEVAQHCHPDLILMDRWMPEMNGIEAAHQIRLDPTLQNIPIIAVSASVTEADQEASIEAGFDAFLSKPIRWSDLEEILKLHLDLDWQYREINQVEPGSKESPDFVPPPQEELMRLYEIALSGDIAALLEQAHAINPTTQKYPAFFTQLRQLADEYDDREILKLIKNNLKP